MNNPVENPYASPQANLVDEAPSALPGDASGLWRDGSYLVVHRKVNVPFDRCVATNEASSQLVPWQIRDREGEVVLSVPVVRGYEWTERLRIAIAAAPIFAGFVFGLAWRQLTPWPGTAIPGMGLIILVGMVTGFVLQLAWFTCLRLFRKKEHYCWIEGVHADYLTTLPKWPYEPVS